MVHKSMSPETSCSTGWAGHSRSRLPPFRRVARTIKQHIEGIVAYVATGLSSARS